MRVYPDRPSLESSQYREVAERFEQPPKYEWTEAEKQPVLDFEQSLLRAEIPSGLVGRLEITEPSKNIINLNKSAVGEGKIWIDYFRSPQGAPLLQALREQAGLSETAGIEQVLAKAAPGIDIKTVRSLAKVSRSHEESKVRAELESWYESGARPETTTEAFSVIAKPGVLLDKAKGLSELRVYYRQVSMALDAMATMGEDPKQIEMERLVLDMQRERLNTVATEIYTWAMMYEEQVARSGEGEEILQQLAEYLPGLHVRASNDALDVARLEKSRARLIGRLDRFINGVGTPGAGPITSDLEQKYIGYEPPTRTEGTEYLLSDVSPEVLESAKATPEQMKVMAEMVLAEWNLLSEERDYDPDKSGAAVDGKWRVVILDTARSFAVDGVKKIIKIPVRDMPVARISPAGALTVLDHELTHVLQHENSEQANLAFVDGGKAARTNLWFEAGAVMEEYASRKRLLGVDTAAPSLNYLAAIESQLMGGDVLDCAKAFADQEFKVSPMADKTTVLDSAANRAPRLFRNGGEFTSGTGEVSSSAVLAYSEQAILGEILPEGKKDWLLVGRMNPDLLSRLHSVGWLDETKFKKLNPRPSEIVMPYVRAKLLSPAEVL